jgi:hypothetical protein
MARAARILANAELAHALAKTAFETASETDRLTRLERELGRGTALEAVDAAAGLRRSQLELTLREYDLVQARFAALIARADCH